jgi:hypothetical protein
MLEMRMSAPVLFTAVAQSGPAAAGPPFDGAGAADRADLPADLTVRSQEKLPLWARMLVIFGGAIASWAVLIATVAAVTR